MERTLLYHCRVLEPEAGQALEDGLVVFNHCNPVEPPDPIGYAGPCLADGAPSVTEPGPEDAPVDLEGGTLLPGFIDLDCVLEDDADPARGALLSFRCAGDALNRGITAIGCAASPSALAVQGVGETYRLWTPRMVCLEALPERAGYAVLRGAPEPGTAEETTYLETARAAKARGDRPAVATGLPARSLPGGLPPLVRAAQLLTQAGFTPMEAIAAITVNNAVLLGIRPQTGTLQTGLEGDVVAVEGDPLQDITCLAKVRMTARGGRLIWSHLKALDRIRFGLVPPGCPD